MKNWEGKGGRGRGEERGEEDYSNSGSGDVILLSHRHSSPFSSPPFPPPFYHSYYYYYYY